CSRPIRASTARSSRRVPRSRPGGGRGEPPPTVSRRRDPTYAARVIDDPNEGPDVEQAADQGADLGHRADYDWGTLLEADAPSEPYALFDRWLAEAESAGEAEFNSMALATVDDGRPTVRNVL